MRSAIGYSLMQRPGLTLRTLCMNEEETLALPPLLYPSSTSILIAELTLDGVVGLRVAPANTPLTGRIQSFVDSEDLQGLIDCLISTLTDPADGVNVCVLPTPQTLERLAAWGHTHHTHQSSTFHPPPTTNAAADASEGPSKSAGLVPV